LNPVATCATSAQLGQYSTSSCTGTAATSNLTTTSCTELTSGNPYFKGSPTAAQVTCGGITPNPNASAALAQQAIGCSPTSPTACEGTGTCVDAKSTFCVYAVGTQSCPLAYPQQIMVASGVKDKYACTTCNCAPSSSSTCSPTVALYYQAACSTATWTLRLDGTSCLSIAPSAASVATIVDAGSPTAASCGVQPGGGVLTGDAELIDPVTVCCTK
jgi:hypothetical protein